MNAFHFACIQQNKQLYLLVIKTEFCTLNSFCCAVSIIEGDSRKYMAFCIFGDCLFLNISKRYIVELNFSAYEFELL